MATILVAGKNGQMGNELQELAPLHPQHEFLFTGKAELDITLPEQIADFIKQHSIQYLINCVAYNQVDLSEERPDIAFLVNATALQNLGRIAMQHGIRIVHFSTDYVFSGEHYLPYTEQDIPAPKTQYGKSKLEGERLLLETCKTSIIVRTSWLYSPFGKNFLKSILHLGQKKKELNVVCDQVGTPTYARDLADTVLRIIEQCESGNYSFTPGIYNFSNEGVCSWYDFACEIKRLAQMNCKINSIESKDFSALAPRPYYSVLNKSKIKHIFDVSIPHWTTSLEECFKRLHNR